MTQPQPDLAIALAPTPRPHPRDQDRVGPRRGRGCRCAPAGSLRPARRRASAPAAPACAVARVAPALRSGGGRPPPERCPRRGRSGPNRSGGLPARHFGEIEMTVLIAPGVPTQPVACDARLCLAVAHGARRRQQDGRCLWARRARIAWRSATATAIGSERRGPGRSSCAFRSSGKARLFRAFWSRGGSPRRR